MDSTSEETDLNSIDKVVSETYARHEASLPTFINNSQIIPVVDITSTQTVQPSLEPVTLRGSVQILSIDKLDSSYCQIVQEALDYLWKIFIKTLTRNTESESIEQLESYEDKPMTEYYHKSSCLLDVHQASTSSRVPKGEFEDSPATIKFYIAIVAGELKYVCEACSACSFTTKKQLAHHKKISHGMFICLICYKYYNKIEEFNCHNPKGYSCIICGKIFIRTFAFITHLQDHFKLKPYDCKICRYSTNDKLHFGMHEAAHRKEKPFVCCICNNSYNSTIAIKQHCEDRHRNECPFCELCFKSTLSLDNHMNYEHV